LVWLNLSYGSWKLKNNNQQPPDDDNTSDAEAMDEDASDLAQVEDATRDEAEIRKQKRFPTDETVSKINGFLKPSVTEYFERG
jgi:hypothetical protein